MITFLQLADAIDAGLKAGYTPEEFDVVLHPDAPDESDVRGAKGGKLINIRGFQVLRDKTQDTDRVVFRPKSQDQVIGVASIESAEKVQR